MGFWSVNVDAIGRDDMEGMESVIGDRIAGLDDLSEMVRILNGKMVGCCLGGELSESSEWTTDVFDCTDGMHGQGY